MNNRGSAFIIVIITIALISIFTGFIYFQLNNQVKSNLNALINIDAKYAAEAGIENTISELIKEIEFQVNNYSLSITKSVKLIDNSYEDNFGKIKNELNKAYKELNLIVKNQNMFNEELKSLYNIISKDYKSIDKLKSDIENFKYSLINSAALETENGSKNIKEKINPTLNYISNSLIKLYSSNKIHNGEEHTPLYIETGSYWGDNIHVIASDIDSKFIGIWSDTSPDYRVNPIQNYVSNVLANNVSSLNDSLRDWSIKNKIITLSNKITGSDGITENSIRNKLISLNNKFNSIRYLNSNIQNYNDDLNKSKKQVQDEIDIVLNYIMNDVEPYIYTLWIDEFTKYNELNDSNYIKIKNILNNIDTIKFNLIELKCKLGYSPLEIDGEVTLPEKPDSSLPTMPNGSNISVNVDEYNYSFDDGYGYSVNAIDSTNIGILYEDNEIKSVDDISFDIISTGTNRGKLYKIKSRVTFKTKKINGIFRTYYEIKSHQKI